MIAILHQPMGLEYLFNFLYSYWLLLYDKHCESAFHFDGFRNFEIYLGKKFNFLLKILINTGLNVYLFEYNLPSLQ